ncbi:MAG: hypothetical protein ACXWAU_04500 [Usitatibacter sp.]
MIPSRLLAIMLAGTVAFSASAGGVYKSIAIDGTILFSDTPPPAEPDDAVARANTQVDLAEHALALARQGLSSPRDGLRLVTARARRSDGERVAFYQKDVQVAHQQLMSLLRQRQVLAD